MNVDEKLEVLIDRYCELFFSDDVIDNDEVISLHTLFNSLKEFFSNVSNTYDNSLKKILKIVNESNCSYELLNGFSSQVNNKSFKNINMHYDDESKRLELIISSFKFSPIILCKDLGRNNYYYLSKNKMDNDTFSLCSEEIDNSFRTIEEEILLFKKNGVFKQLKTDKINQEFTYNDLNYSVSYDDLGRVGIKIRFNELIDPDNVQKHCFNGMKNIEYLLYINHDNVSKKIPVLVSDIDSLSKELVDKYRKKKEKTM